MTESGGGSGGGGSGGGGSGGGVSGGGGGSGGGFDWPVLMRAGMRGLGLTPDQFWALTPAELQLLVGAQPGSGPMGRARLDELLAAYPDTTKGSADG